MCDGRMPATGARQPNLLSPVPGSRPPGLAGVDALLSAGMLRATSSMLTAASGRRCQLSFSVAATAGS